MENKIEIEYERKFVNYIFINQRIYFTFSIIAFEVFFKVCMKSIDILGEDTNFYYIIEVKREVISEDDYNNLVCIMRNNRHDKPFKGILIGTKRNKKVERMCMENGNIECVIIDDVIYKKNAEELTYLELDRDSNEPPYAKILKKLFENITGLNSISNRRNINCIDIIYNYKSNRELWVKITRDSFDIVPFMKHPIFEEKYIEDKEIYIGKNHIDEFMFTNKYLYKLSYMKCRFFTDKSIKDNYCEIYNVLHPLQDYIDLEKVKFNEYDNFLITDTNYLGIHIMKIKFYHPREKYIIIPSLYKYIFENNEDKIGHIVNTYDYNKVNFIQCCYVFIGNKLYKPSIKINYYNKYLDIELEVRLKDGTAIKRNYEVIDKNHYENKKMIKKEFFLICNVYFILDFEEYVKNIVNNNKSKIHEHYFDSYVTSRYKHLVKNKKYLTLREIINMQDNKIKLAYDEVMDEEYSRVKEVKWREEAFK
ncbi:hypothetical protein [Clostridium sp. UBA5988]|uniref:hypothetical protein n=1 Tax=Clostridium sp. UBA5988 TaxID=1946369 RepID=UPI003217989A